MIPQRLERLRQEMAKRNIAIYVVPTSDFHDSEYVGDHFKTREYVTGFTGSAGTAVITMTEAGLWTDGRYFVQAAKQLEGTTVTLYRMGEEGVPTVNEYLEKTLQEGETLGFDGRVISGFWGQELEEIVSEKNGTLQVEEDLVDLIWEDRPTMPQEPVWILKEQYSGRSTGDKLADIRKVMEEKKADIHLISSLYDICWILNIRGNDISYVPVVLSYLALTKEKCIWFVQEQVITEEIRAYLEDHHITTMPYESFYNYIGALGDGHRVLIDREVANYRICNSLPKSVKVIDERDPSVLMRALKNQIEVQNTRNAHIKDAVAMCRFMYWLKSNVGKIPMTEISVADHLEALRKQQDGFIELSFETICGYADHGAIVHYAATEESDVELRPQGLLLVDSGGHYLEGTTDITRTFALGEVTEDMRADFTRVCRANMNLANARFLYGCTGVNLDILAREPLWEAGLDYKHGTGHGVGYILNVHEGPNAFRWRNGAGRNAAAVLEEGMITTDEPGIYREGKYGIRTENELICMKAEKNEYGQFMCFENITYVPIDLDALAPEQMTEKERRYLNEYHAKVYEVVAPLLEEEEAKWLKEYTRAI
ncbi:MAG: aminopeptidase P family protein [Agathobacter sp.]|nr:aminopeptidase P family protein [Agathobacter sp.]